MYSRNYLYITEEEQNKLKDYRIVIAGVGLGSNIAECAVKMGFQKFVLIDGDRVEHSNLNRQQYTTEDVGEYKVFALQKRLQSINPKVSIKSINEFITTRNAHEFLKDCDVIMNATEYSSDVPFFIDRMAVDGRIPVIHAYNFGWAGCAFVINEKSEDLMSLSPDSEMFELKMAEYIIKKREEEGGDCGWLRSMLMEYKQNYSSQSPPQLAIASHLVAAMVCRILFCLVTGKVVKLFPEIYFKESL